jgi:ribonuclease P protein component
MPILGGMIPFRNLFTFNRREVDEAFKHAHLKKYHEGLTLLEAPLNQISHGQPHGKLLIIIAAAAGMAHERNAMKRRLRSVFYQEKLYRPHHSFWILIVKKKAVNMPFKAIEDFLKESLS